MSNKDVYIYYSGATDVTGSNLKEVLAITGGTAPPKTAKRVIIGWGAKTKDKVTFGKAVVLNHPDKIRSNRNKFKTLEMLKGAGVKVADFVDAGSVMNALTANNHITLPLIGRKSFHQGGKGFWLCLTKHQVKDAIEKGAQYFQNYVPILDEFRLHIFGGNLLYAVKKVQRKNMDAAFKEQHGEKIKNSAAKGNKELDEATVDYVLEKMAPRVQPDPDMIIRSNMKGWKFSHVKKVDSGLLTEATNALKAAGLDFGAVDCCTDENGNPWIIEINSGPGLDGTSFDVYVKAFQERISEILNPKKAAAVKKTVKKDKVTVEQDEIEDGDGSVKSRLAAKAKLMSDLIQNANEEEASVLEGVFSKMFGSGS